VAAARSRACRVRGHRLHVAAADSLHASSASESRPSWRFSCHTTRSTAVLHRELHSRAGVACCPGAGAGVACTSHQLEPRLTTRVLLDQHVRYVRDGACVARRMYLLVRLLFHVNYVNYREITFVSTRERTMRFAAASRLIRVRISASPFFTTFCCLPNRNIKRPCTMSTVPPPSINGPVVHDTRSLRSRQTRPLTFALDPRPVSRFHYPFGLPGQGSDCLEPEDLP
jgi:hypothetical protein